MRFKKLRVLVGISIALFILIVGIVMLKAVTVNNASNHRVNVNSAPVRYIYYPDGQIVAVRVPSQQNAQVAHPTMMTGAS